MQSGIIRPVLDPRTLPFIQVASKHRDNPYAVENTEAVNQEDGISIACVALTHIAVLEAAGMRHADRPLVCVVPAQRSQHMLLQSPSRTSTRE